MAHRRFVVDQHGERTWQGKATFNEESTYPESFFDTVRDGVVFSLHGGEGNDTLSDTRPGYRTTKIEEGVPRNAEASEAIRCSVSAGETSGRADVVINGRGDMVLWVEKEAVVMRMIDVA